MAMRGEERGIGYIILKIDIRPPLQEKRGGGSVTIATSPHKSTPSILEIERENQRHDNQRKGEKRGIGYIGLEIHLRPPLQEKRGGDSLTSGTSPHKRTVAPLERRELERWQ
jgi:hypothetical protein